jgi:hypothetical protein
MPKFELVEREIPDLLPMDHRAPGLHVSSIIHDLCIELGHYEDSSDKKLPMTRLQIGQAIEWALIERMRRHFPDRYGKVGELTLDGISGNADLFDHYDFITDEIKCTWLSARHADDPSSKKLWKYWVQLKAYCRMLETGIGRLHIVCLNGYYTYKDGDGPQYRLWKAAFSRKELDDNWAMLRKHGAKMIRDGKVIV